MLKHNVSQENWFALLDNLNAAAMQQSQKKRKAFVTLVPDENRQLVTLTFDANDYKSNVQSDVSMGGLFDLTAVTSSSLLQVIRNAIYGDK